MYHINVNVKFMTENVIPIKIGITINVNVIVKIQENMRPKKIIFGILVHILVKIKNIWKTLLVIQ